MADYISSSADSLTITAMPLWTTATTCTTTWSLGTCEWVYPTSEPKPSCKCKYCECTNDHIYGTCDYCGAPL